MWIGRFFILDNDVGEHWFDNWDLRADRADAAARLQRDTDRLFFIDPDRFQDGAYGPCHSPDARARFWRDVLRSLALSVKLLADEAVAMISHRRKLLDAAPFDEALQKDYIPDLEARIAEVRTWSVEVS